MMHAESLSKPLVRTDVYLSEFQRDTMKELGREQDISMAELIRRVLDKHLRRALKKQTAQK
jgi:predicted DNA-binding ribbon-helix-helix protein